MTSLSQVTVVGVLPVYLFLNQMEVTECVQTTERWTVWLRLTHFLSHGWMTAMTKWEKLDTSRSLIFLKDSGKFHWQTALRRFQLVTPDGLYQYKVMPFGMKNSPASFQRLINKVVTDLEDCEAYIDDVITYSDTWEEHLRINREFFKRLSRAMLTINLSKMRVWPSAGNLSWTRCWTRWS